MKRYTLDSFIRYDTDGPNAEAAMVETDDGEWVRQDEAHAEVERLMGENEMLRRALHGLVCLPVARREISLLRRGIGVATANKAWLVAFESLTPPSPTRV